MLLKFNSIQQSLSQALPYRNSITGAPKKSGLPNAVGKQPSIPLINLGRQWTLS